MVTSQLDNINSLFYISVFQIDTDLQSLLVSCTNRHTSPPHMVVVFPAPLCPRKETTWFSWRLRLSLLRASLLPVLYTLVSLSIHTTSGRWLGSSSMPRISSGVGGEMRKGEISGVGRYFLNIKIDIKKLPPLSLTMILVLVLIALSLTWSFCGHLHARLECVRSHTHTYIIQNGQKGYMTQSIDVVIPLGPLSQPI